MNDKKKQQVARIQRYAHMIEQQTGKAVRPYRADGYVNLMNKYGTSKDTTEHYQFAPEADVPDDVLTLLYEGNGLFARVIDAPAEEAIKHGFKLEDVSDTEVETFYQEALDELDWEEVAMTGIKWARLFGGSIAVMLINDGGGLEEPLNWKNIKSIDDIRVYDRSVIQPDYSTMFNYDPRNPFRTRGSRLGMPEFYHVSSRFGSFTVHESRCLVFQNGVLPENTSNIIYQLWGMPEYIRIHRALRDAELAHGSAPKMLDRSVQAVYKMKDLSMLLATDEGESQVLKRLQVIDMARGLLNSLVIDNEGEDYDFKSFQYSGVAEVIDATCNFLSALTNIPQTILFGRSPAGMNSTGESDLENWYSYCERIQKRMLKSNLRYLLSIIFQAGIYTGEVDEVPKIKVAFNPLKVLSDSEKAELDNKKASTELIKAQTAQIYRDMEVLDSTEIRRKLADSDEFDIDTILDEYESEEELMAIYEQQEAENPGLIPGTEQTGVEPFGLPSGEKGGHGNILTKDKLRQYGTGVDIEKHEADPGTEGSAPANAPAATKLPQDMSKNEIEEISKQDEAPYGVGVLVIKDGRILCGSRHNDTGYGLICGPGGHGEKGETYEQSAIRETQEEFGITPKNLIPIGVGPLEPESKLRSHIFLCTDFDGEVSCNDLEMVNPKFRTMEELEELKPSLFPPFADSLEILKDCLFNDNEDGGPGSGNHGHEGRPGEVGGSLPSGGDAGLPTLPRDKSIAVLQKFGVGTTVNITKKNGQKVLFTKLGDDQWSRDDQPGKVYQDVGVSMNCWKSEVEVTAKKSEKPEERREIAEGVEKAEEKAEKKAEENEAKEAPKPTGKYAKLSDKVDEVKKSQMTKAEKADAYKQMVNEAEPGTTFKCAGIEYRKTGDPDYPLAMIDFEGKAFRHVRDVDWDIEYSADKDNCIEFFDKDAIVAGRKETAAKMKKSGKFSTSDEVHAERPGKITLNSENFGEAGDYVVYRNGSIGSSGMIFFSPKKEGADSYSFAHGGSNTGEYEVHLEKPLVIRGETDVECIKKAYETLHPGKAVKGPLTSAKWISCDKANASALNSGTDGYDSVVYIINGKPSEVQVSAKKAKKSVKKTGEYTVAEWSKSGHTYEEAAARGYIDETAEDYKRVDSAFDGFGDDGVHCSESKYDAILSQVSTEMNISENISAAPEKPIDFSPENNTIKSQETSEDGAPKGNQNAAGPHQRSHLSKADQEKYTKRIVGQKTSDGITVTGFWNHAFDRIAQRNMSMGQIEKLLQNGQVSPDKTYPNRNCYDVPGKRLVLDKNTGEIVTIEWRKQNK